MKRYKLDKRHRKENGKAIFHKKTYKLFFCSLYGNFKPVLSCRLAPWHSVKRADFCPFDLSMTCPYKNANVGERTSLGNLAWLFCYLLIFSKSTFWKIPSGWPSGCPTVRIEIRTDLLLGLIWVQTVCKDYTAYSLWRVTDFMCMR